MTKKQSLFFIVTLTVVSTAVCAASFTDATKHRYKAAIDYISTAGIVQGYADGTYKPDATINRAELTKIILGASGISTSDNLSGCFPDVTSQWYARYVCKAKNLGIISGYPDGRFRPEQSVTLVEALKIMEKAYGATVATSDVWYKAYVEEASAKNIIPLDIRTFDEKLTRGQMADMITRYLKFKDGTQAAYLQTNFGIEGTKAVTYDSLNASKGKNGNAPNSQPPAEAISACTGKAEGATCTFSDRGTSVSGMCDTKPGVLACAPAKNGQGAGPANGGSASSGTKTSAATDISKYASCINNTKDGPQCKDCCDCLTGSDQATRTACRDTCATHEFSGNTNLITVSAPSTLGANGNYSQCVAAADSAACKTCCEESMGLMCGDYRYCRTACNNKFGDTKSSQGTTPPNTVGQQSSKPNPGTGGSNEYSIAQAISDNAQLSTLAFGGLGFLTGNTCSDSFLPPGKVADFFGFQYLRDITQSGKGHSTDFVTNAANNVLKTLDTSQKAKMLALAKTQASLVNSFAYARFPLMVAFRRQLTGTIPSGTTGLSKSAVMSYSADLYEKDAQISIQRAQLFAEILKSLTTEQKAFLDTMVKGGFASWAALPDQLDKQSMTHDENVLMMTYASEMFAWYAGDTEADTYFCPERQGDYFGGFYIKDAPAMGNAGYTIDESITGDKGQAFINALSATQKPIITSIVDTQRTAINGIVEKRRAIATELRKALTTGTIDQSTVTTLARTYGQLDGEISYYYATAFAQVGKTLTTAQKSTLLSIKDLGNYTCPDTQAYLYSEKITMPTVESTDFLFQ